MSSQGNSRQRRFSTAVSFVLFGIGAALCIVFLSRSFSWNVFAVALSVLVGLRFIIDRGDSRRMRGPLTSRTWARTIAALTARAGLLVFDLFALYLAIAWGGVLWWTTAWWIRLVIAVLVAAWLFGRFTRPAIPRVPLVLPLGVWIVVCLLGWLREESFVRCDDYARLRAPVSILLPTTTAVAQCHPGESLPIGRYPRKFWQSPDGRWLRFTTQSGNDYAHAPGRLNGLVCELDLADSSPEPRCLVGASGKSHGIVGAAAIGKVFFAGWSLPADSHGRTSAIFTLPQDGPLAIEAEHRFDGSVADLIFEPKSRTLHTFFDSNDRIVSVQLPGFDHQVDTMVSMFPGQVHYDPTRDEGVVCGLLTGAAIRADPLSYRFFGTQAPTIWSVLAVSWGCDWDPVSRRVYTAVPSLGLLYVVDYDSGQILRKDWVGFGMRTATLDQRRGVVYLTDFLGGHVVAFDTTAGKERERWFVGRFVREAYLSRQGDSLFVSSNIGVLQIRLNPVQ